MAKNTVNLLERGVFLPAEAYDKNDIIPHLKKLLSSAKKSFFELGNIQEADNFFMFFKLGEPISFQYKLELEGGEWINIRDYRKFVVDLAFAAFSEAKKKNDQFPLYQEAFDLSVSTPSVYNKNKRELSTGQEMEFYALYVFSERDEAELKKLILQNKKEEAKPKIRHAPPMKKVERDGSSIQEILAGKMKAPAAISLMAPADAEAETLAQENEISSDESPAEMSIFTVTEPVSEPVVEKTSTRKKSTKIA